MTDTNFVQLFFNSSDMTVSLVLNLWALILLLFAAAVAIIVSVLHRKSKRIANEMIPVKLKYSVGGAELEYQIVRDFTNIEIAHRVYVELVTRKAAITIDEKNDVIVEVYDSWYSLFRIVRDELKTMPGRMLRDNEHSKDLVKLLTDLLNLGLRPHLTQYQALFRKWYAEELDRPENRGKSPQQIQNTYSDYGPLIQSVKQVNQLLIAYANELKKVVDGN